MNIQKNITTPLKLQIIMLSTIVIAMIVLFLYSFSFTEQEWNLWFAEDGPIENISAAGYFVCAALILCCGNINYFKKHYCFIATVLLFGMRELDFHSRFTTMGILKTKFFVSNLVPLHEKFIGLLVIAFLVFLVVIMIKNYRKDFLTKLLSLSPVHIGATLAFILLAMSKTFDGFARKLHIFNIEVTPILDLRITTIEETVEVGVPLVLLATFYIYFFHITPAKDK